MIHYWVFLGIGRVEYLYWMYVCFLDCLYNWIHSLVCLTLVWLVQSHLFLHSYLYLWRYCQVWCLCEWCLVGGCIGDLWNIGWWFGSSFDGLVGYCFLFLGRNEENGIHSIPFRCWERLLPCSSLDSFLFWLIVIDCYSCCLTLIFYWVFFYFYLGIWDRIHWKMILCNSFFLWTCCVVIIGIGVV